METLRKTLSYLIPTLVMTSMLSAPAWAGAEPPEELILLFFAILVFGAIFVLAVIGGAIALIVKAVRSRTREIQARGGIQGPQPPTGM